MDGPVAAVVKWPFVPRVTMDLTLDSRQISVSVRRRELERLHDPLVREIARRAQRVRGRLVVLLAGPPGCGKTTLSALWVRRAEQLGLPVSFQALPMDGFHLPNAELDRRTGRTPDGQVVPLRRLKGSPQSYDLDSLAAMVARLREPGPVRWPRYDRTIHDPVPDAIPVLEHGAAIVEGNFLLHEETGIPSLRGLADLTILVQCTEEFSRAAIVERYRRNRDPAEVLRHIEEVDAPNWRRATESSAEIVLRVDGRRALKAVRFPAASDGHPGEPGLK